MYDADTQSNIIVGNTEDVSITQSGSDNEEAKKFAI